MARREAHLRRRAHVRIPLPELAELLELDVTLVACSVNLPRDELSLIVEAPWLDGVSEGDVPPAISLHDARRAKV